MHFRLVKNFFAKTYFFANEYFTYVKKIDGQFSNFILQKPLFKKENLAKILAKICNFEFLQFFFGEIL